ncbi:hypothetical protein QYE76_031367 [Lolium multiflorum]|uniref:Uncharacterized protein n=1 Tax=Lolium multiflorum TaxID=4521 RepID=A0AAD8QUY1_LOLMU|nr:hypothetical protein QYE76_031367 [Lolium multiflorum]
MSITLGAATKLLDDMMINYSEWHTERAPQGKKVNSVEETSSLSDKIDVIMSMLVNGRSNVDSNNVPLASLVAQEENVDVNFIKNNNFNNNAYRNNSGNNYRPYPSANGNGYGNSYGNSYNNNRSVPSGLEAMLKEFISTQTAFNKSVEEKLDKIDTIASRVDRLASDVNLLKLKVMPNNDIDNKITTTANAIQVRINENIRLMAELRARWDREENEKLAKENNVAKVWTITTTSNANSSHVAAPPTINGKIIGVGNVSTPSAKRTKLPEIAKTAETACDKTAEIFSNLGNNDPIAVDHNDLDFDDCHISEVIKLAPESLVLRRITFRDHQPSTCFLAPTMEPYVQTETYDLENGGSLVFERDLYLVSEKLERPPPQFHGVRIHDTPTGEQQWMITADLKGSSEPPISERILFSFKAYSWVDGLAHALQEGLARVCGQNIAALRGSRFAYFARHDTMGEPMALSSHPVLKIHVQHLDFMLHETRKDLELTRVHAHRAQMALAHHADAIRMLAKDRKSLRLQRAKKDATISRLREKIRTLEVTVRTQQDQIQEMEEDGEDIQGGDDFLSDDNDFEDDEFTDEEDYAFLESEEDGIIPIDVDEDDEE